MMLILLNVNIRYLSIYLCIHFFLQHPVFFVYKPFISLFKFIHKKFIVPNDIISQIAFFISLLNSSLLVYNSAIDFCTLIQHPKTLLNLFIMSNRFLVVQDLLCTGICHQQRQTLILQPLAREFSFYAKQCQLREQGAEGKMKPTSSLVCAVILKSLVLSCC